MKCFPSASLVLCFFSLYSSLIPAFSYKISPSQFWSSCLSESTHFYVLITIGGSRGGPGGHVPPLDHLKFESFF